MSTEAVKYEGAIAIARGIANAEGWPWHLPVDARMSRTFWLIGPRVWHVTSNIRFRGRNVRVQIDADSGRIISKAFCPR